MNNQMQEQMASDLHTLAAPFRFIGGMIQTALMILAVPLLLAGGVVYFIVTGQSPMSKDELEMVTAFCRLALFLSIIWLPFMFIGSHIRKLGYCAVGSIVMFLMFMIEPRPHHVEFVLTFPQLAAMVLLPIALVVAFYTIKRGQRKGNTLRPEAYESVKANYIKWGLVNPNADFATVAALYAQRTR